MIFFDIVESIIPMKEAKESGDPQFRYDSLFPTQEDEDISSDDMYIYDDDSKNLKCLIGDLHRAKERFNRIHGFKPSSKIHKFSRAEKLFNFQHHENQVEEEAIDLYLFLKEH
jgi:hypothetical protein